jgi:hypothetical protein
VPAWGSAPCWSYAPCGCNLYSHVLIRSSRHHDLSPSRRAFVDRHPHPVVVGPANRAPGMDQLRSRAHASQVGSPCPRTKILVLVVEGMSNSEIVERLTLGYLLPDGHHLATARCRRGACLGCPIGPARSAAYSAPDRVAPRFRPPRWLCHLSSWRTRCVRQRTRCQPEYGRSGVAGACGTNQLPIRRLWRWRPPGR